MVRAMGEVKTSSQNGDYVTLKYYHPSSLTIDGQEKKVIICQKKLDKPVGQVVQR
jgi:hypothetical protein